MPSTSIDGVSIYYEVMGHGDIPVCLSPGGQAGVDTLRVIAEPISERYRVIMWDRSNLGRSDVSFKGAKDLDLWSDQMRALLIRLDAFPAYLVGASSASRLMLAAARRYPEMARGVFAWNVSAGGVSVNLGVRYYGQYADVALKGGMKAVCETPFWAERIQENSANKGLLMATNPIDFARVMRRWSKAIGDQEDIIIGTSEDEMKRVRVPTLIVGGEDNGHPRERSDRVAKLIPDIEYITPPQFKEEWDLANKGPVGWMHSAVPMVPDLLHDFIKKTEPRYKARVIEESKPGPVATGVSPYTVSR